MMLSEMLAGLGIVYFDNTEKHFKPRVSEKSPSSTGPSSLLSSHLGRFLSPKAMEKRRPSEVKSFGHDFQGRVLHILLRSLLYCSISAICWMDH